MTGMIACFQWKGKVSAGEGSQLWASVKTFCQLRIIVWIING